MHISLQKITNNLSMSLVNISTLLANNNNLSMSINNLSEVLKNSPHITASISTQPLTTTPPSILSPSSSSPLPFTTTLLSPLPSTTTTTSSSSSSTSTSTISSTSTSSTSSTSTTSFPSTMYFTSSNVVLSRETNNWLIPYKSFRSAYFACSYFGHRYKECPNIKKTPNDPCLNCWRSGHTASKCPNDKIDPPFLEGYISPNEMIEKYFDLK
ncbi:hypothetical protein GLOIN_2v1883110 [Rhizophagus clarus]|uniref:CCHC-type domain-containing protein n=1 Tax=Rhizophagus clarus TaxID=94130 RepID=A0A8H3LD91_9GLOM|nr:hypothetical protein GLOIN_2v1883110 [Rhizophagus clarus]